MKYSFSFELSVRKCYGLLWVFYGQVEPIWSPTRIWLGHGLSRHFSTGLFSEVVLVIELDLSQASIKCPNYYKGDSSDFPMIEGLMLDFIRAPLSILFSNPAGALNYRVETAPPPPPQLWSVYPLHTMPAKQELSARK